MARPRSLLAARRWFARPAALAGGVAALLGASGGGCVEREMVITSEPQGALVYLNDQEVGRTPLRREFTWYGTYDVAVRADGHETLKTRTAVIAPAWQFVPLDFVAEILPFRLTDTHKLHYTLKPNSEQQTDPREIIERGQAFRTQLQSSDRPATNPAP